MREQWGIILFLWLVVIFVAMHNAAHLSQYADNFISYYNVTCPFPVLASFVSDISSEKLSMSSDVSLSMLIKLFLPIYRYLLCCCVFSASTIHTALELMWRYGIDVGKHVFGQS
jgi:hypothetical protein